jgi:hypothetical protein
MPWSHVPLESGQLWSTKQRDAHPLHEISYRACFKPALAGYFIERFSNPGDTVHDPFMGRGTTPLEASLRGRIASGSDANPLSEMLVAPRLDPPSLTEVESWLEKFNWNRSVQTPAELLAFYHPVTIRHICLLRERFLEKPLDKTAAWVRMAALNRLTGHSPGFFSVRTLPPNQAVSVQAQLTINSRRNQCPPQRDVAALILKKSRSLLRPPARPLPPDAAGHRLWTALAEAPSPLHDNSTALVVTSPPFLNVVDYRRDNWLRCWFAGIDTSTLPRCTGSLELWANHLSTVLSEIHRILKPGGHAAIEVGEIRKGKLRLEETVAECGHRGGLVPVKFLIQTQTFTKTARCWGIKNNTDGTNTHRVVLFQKQ